ncbi:DUF7344 domain-containing protein [Halomarina oriensis]|uniref:DUF7344 domain-containing protein n=1 Tax=Halomarina oriensis TaxID=671145 RepID=A0A6B0GNQ7_9EURY|nr:hypothetical protein [Halomarina oriensis]MWG33228.1 hypothetical protein [Halomarina oriensis]
MHKFTEAGGFDGQDGSENETVLTDDRCRFALYDLISHFHPVPVYDLADRLLAWERTRNDERLTFEEVQERLRDDHLPALQSVGLVETTTNGTRYTASRRALDFESTIRELEADTPAEE